ncbi:MAG: hypothetical protein MJ089_03750 [Ruminococcus sp.]|nr:hypothetical protein [Ruminococcus sp.]
MNEWCIWKIIANISKFEGENNNIWDKICEKYISALSSNNICEFSIACDCSRLIVQSCPQSSEAIFEALKNVNERKFVMGNNISVECHNIAIEKATQALSNLLE